MEAVTRRAIAAHTLAVAYVAGWADRARRRDRGQASVEYAGVMFVVVALVAAVIAAGFTEVGTTLKQKIISAITNLGGGGGAAGGGGGQ